MKINTSWWLWWFVSTVFFATIGVTILYCMALDSNTLSALCFIWGAISGHFGIHIADDIENK